MLLDASRPTTRDVLATSTLPVAERIRTTLIFYDYAGQDPINGSDLSGLTIEPVESDSQWGAMGDGELWEEPSASPAGGDEESSISVNQANGNAGRDAIASRYPGSRIEVTRQTELGARRIDVLTPTGDAI
jgi:hypothetical protein